MELELHLVGTSSRWRLSAARNRIGRDPACEVALPAERYPMVSREHAILTMENGRVRLSDNQSTNGIFVNGTHTASAMLTRLDCFKLGKDGPEFEIRILEEQPSGVQTVISTGGTAPMPTQVPLADRGAAPTRIAKPAELAQPSIQKTDVRPPEPADQASPVSCWIAAVHPSFPPGRNR